MDIQKAIHHVRAIRTSMYMGARETGPALDMAIEALEKQTPKKAGLCTKFMEFRCVVCHNPFYYGESNIPENFDFCPKCGQKLDWSGE